MAKSGNKLRRCSFCGRTEEQVHKLLAGPEGVFICDQCVDICVDMLEEEYEDFQFDELSLELPKPEQLSVWGLSQR